jgi:signal peptidase
MPSWFPRTCPRVALPRRLLRASGCIYLGAALALVVVLTAPVILTPFGYRVYVIYGGSMGSALPVGSVGLSKTVDSSSLEVGDIIAVKRAGGGIPVLHRVVNIKTDGDANLYVTQGDKNSSADPEPARLQGTGDKVVFAIPYLGYVVHFVRSALGRTLFLFLPSSVLVVSVLWQRPRPTPQPVHVAWGEPEC